MSSEPPPPPNPPNPPKRSLSAQNRLTSSSQDIPAQGRLADVSRASTPALTREGNVRAKFLPRVVPRKAAESTLPAAATTGGSLLSDKNQRGPVPGATTAGRGRGRGRGRGEVITGISGPFAAGPAMHESRSRRGLSDHGSSLTVERVPIEGTTPVQTDLAAAATLTAPTVKREGEPSSQKPPTPRKKAPPKPRIKKEDEDEFDSPDELDGEVEERIDLAELNFPGGPISSSRKNDRTVRGWKKIELWIEQEDAEEIIIDDTPPPPPQPGQVTVKLEDDPSAGVVVHIPESMVMEEEPENTDVVQTRPARRRRHKKSLKGKSREEKEEMAREELDLEVLKEQLLTEDGSEREQKLLLLQLPATLPPLKDIIEAEVKEEVKSEDLAAAAAAAPPPIAPPPSGKIGQLRVHASGKTVLSYGGIDFAVRLASDIGFAQDFVAINPYEENGGKAWRLGSVGEGQEGGWLIGVPELKGIAKHHG